MPNDVVRYPRYRFPLLQPRRNRHAAARFFRKLLKRSGRVPLRLVTDRLGSYRAAHRVVMPSVVHGTTRYTNNRPKSHTSRRADASANHPETSLPAGRPTRAQSTQVLELLEYLNLLGLLWTSNLRSPLYLFCTWTPAFSRISPIERFSLFKLFDISTQQADRLPPPPNQ